MDAEKHFNKTQTSHSTRNDSAASCWRKFLRYFPKGFADETFVSWERGYKWNAHEKWNEQLNRREYEALLRKKEFSEIAGRAVKIESPTNMIFSFEKMALRDAVKSDGGARLFAEGLFEFLHGTGEMNEKFDRWREAVSESAKKIVARFNSSGRYGIWIHCSAGDAYFSQAERTQNAARKYGFDFQCKSQPSWEIYRGLLEFAEQIKFDLEDLKPRDMIDIQSFIWVNGLSEYDE